MAGKKIKLTLLVSLILVFVACLFFTADYGTYLLETSPVIIGLILVLFIYKKFQFSNIIYFFLWLGAMLIIIGGFYTYAGVPIFSWISDVSGLTRNYYDRFGHIFQGLISALVFSEIFRKTAGFKNKKWFFFTMFCAVLAVSASWEIIEMAVCYAFEDKTQVFLAIQSDFWDTQWDMVCSIIGFIFFIIFFRNIRFNQINELPE